MSLSEPKLTNPAVKYIEYKSDKGEFQYYDKEKAEHVIIKMPINFIVLDELSAIKGYNQQQGCGVYSNEIRYVKDEILNVRTFKGGLSVKGKYQEIKDEALRLGGKYCKSVYAMLLSKDSEGKPLYELVNFQFHGASFSGTGEKCRSGWISKRFNTEQYSVMAREVEQGKNGAVVFTSPIFEQGFDLNQYPQIRVKAIEMDKTLQKYLKVYLNNQIEKVELSENEVGLEPTEMEKYMEENYPDLHERVEEVKGKTEDVEGFGDLPF